MFNSEVRSKTHIFFSFRGTLSSHDWTALITHGCILGRYRRNRKRKPSDEEILMRILFHGYNPAARPVLQSTSTVEVKMQFSLMHIKDLVSFPSVIWSGLSIDPLVRYMLNRIWHASQRPATLPVLVKCGRPYRAYYTVCMLRIPLIRHDRNTSASLSFP